LPTGQQSCHEGPAEAYIVGDHTGCFSEDNLDVGQRFRNAREQSKFEAEFLLADQASRA